jgi:hypothetical protein
MCGRPKRPPQLAHAQNDLIWTAADVTKLDLVAAHIGTHPLLALIRSAGRPGTLPALLTS